MKNYLDSEIAPEQAGFRTGRGTRDQLFNMRLIMEKMREANIPLLICFIDYSKAFDCVNELQIILNSVMQISDDFGLLVKVKKTKVMAISKTEIQANILINNEKIEQVSSFTYLGADLNQQNHHSTEIRRRLAMARTSTTKLWKIWKDRSVNIKTKLRLLKSLIWPIALAKLGL